MGRQRFQDRLDDLRDSVLAMGDLVLDRLETAIDALQNGDDDAARAVLEGDDVVNERYLAIEDACIDLFALEQPVASDLRLVAASFKIITDLERIADLAVNLAGYAIDPETDLDDVVDLQDLGRVARSMVEDAIEAYRTEDVWSCHEIADRDDELDRLCEHASQALMRDLIEHGGGSAAGSDDVEAAIDAGIRLGLVVRDLERVGDHAVNVAARTLYVAENDDALLY
jgi:phosphate transport system protein